MTCRDRRVAIAHIFGHTPVSTCTSARQSMPATTRGVVGVDCVPLLRRRRLRLPHFRPSGLCQAHPAMRGATERWVSDQSNFCRALMHGGPHVGEIGGAPTVLSRAACSARLLERNRGSAPIRSFRPASCPSKRAGGPRLPCSRYPGGPPPDPANATEDSSPPGVTQQSVTRAARDAVPRRALEAGSSLGPSAAAAEPDGCLRRRSTP